MEARACHHALARAKRCELNLLGFCGLKHQGFNLIFVYNDEGKHRARYFRYLFLRTDVTHPDSFFDKKRAQKLISAVETLGGANQCQKREARDAMHSKSMPETRGRRRFAIASLQR